ncbi:GNAT family N-acetyltransferase [Brachybacterium phenoliresistens]|uniref:GNAT family N-acetyltransferase n=1 Tax=Brachybacterium phenoliresistens TaxID=396014 RepID=UPI0031E4123D
MIISADDPHRADVLALLAQHLGEMHRTSPAESVHALDPDALADPSITLLSAREEDGTLLGIGALQRHDGRLGEVKSMRTAPPARGRGVGAAVLGRIIALAQEEGLETLALETGTDPFFAAAHRLYARHGFAQTGPFAEYREDPCSAYFSLSLHPA